ncbi:peroxiredoxin [Deinococcus hohokamensis]|uniref:thioredoxin-dependent peroxiredoxin n=1 Tax=Deinococcus hohokamensis TaxID=309883 RepID=A0ABV9I314_9DEIO
MALHEGDRVPPFTATQDNGQPYVPQSGRWQVLFFFPKAATTHCQLQARRYQAVAADFRELGVDVVGINSDPRREQVSFRELCVLDYPLLADEGHVLTEMFGVMDDPWPGEQVRRARRETFLVDPQGVIVRHWTNVDPGTDATTVLEDVRSRVS